MPESVLNTDEVIVQNNTDQASVENFNQEIENTKNNTKLDTNVSNEPLPKVDNTQEKISPDISNEMKAALQSMVKIGNTPVTSDIDIISYANDETLHSDIDFEQTSSGKIVALNAQTGEKIKQEKVVTNFTNADGTPATKNIDGSVSVTNEDDSITVINGDIRTTYPKGMEIPAFIPPSKNTRSVDGEKPSLTTDQASDQMIGKIHVWEGDTISYQLDTSSMTEFEQQQARKAFEEWNKLIGVNIVETTDGKANIRFQNGETAQNVAGYSNAVIEKADLSFWDRIKGGAPNKVFVEVVISDRYNEKDFEEGKNPYSTYMHEIGHALGISHPGNYNGLNADGSAATYEGEAEYKEDTDRYSIMSYFDANADDSGTNHNGKFASTPMLHDVAAAQKLYGKNETTNNGSDDYIFKPSATTQATYQTIDMTTFDDVINTEEKWGIYVASIEKYASLSEELTGSNTIRGEVREQWNDELKALFPDLEFVDVTETAGFKSENTPDSIKTLYDTDGIDTIDASAFDSSKQGYTIETTNKDGTVDIETYGKTGPIDQTISLVAGTYSSIGYMTNNVSIAEGVVIENAITADGNDTITGNDVSNSIRSGGGDDIVNSGKGNDWVYAGEGNDTINGGEGDDVIHDSEGDDIVNGGNGNDTLWNGAGNDIVNTGNGSDNVIDGAGDDIYTFDNLKETRQLMPEGYVDDTIRFKYDLEAPSGNDTINNLSNYDKIDIDAGGNAPKITFTQVGDNVVVNYGSGTITVTDTYIDKVKNAVEVRNHPTYGVTPRPSRLGLT